jgi:hypothetical protein
VAEADRLCGTRGEVAYVFPGVVRTDVFRPRPARAGTAAGSPAATLDRHNAGRTAQAPVFLAQDPPASGTRGRFYGPRLKQLAVPNLARDPERRRGLWDAEPRVKCTGLNAAGVPRGGAVQESKVIPTAVVAMTRKTLCIRDLPVARLGPGQKLSRMGYQKVTERRVAREDR